MRCLVVALLCWGCLAAALQLDVHVQVPKGLQHTVDATARQLPHNQIDFQRRAEPHVTLYLTDFEDHLVANVTATVKRVLEGFHKGAATVNLTGVDTRSPYALWNAAPNAGLQRLSDALVTALARFAKPNQTVPAWVYALPPAERNRKIAMVRKYGSPNVFSEFDPHVTLAYDTVDNMTALFEHIKLSPQSYVASKVGVSLVGPFGTVLRSGQLASFPLSQRVEAASVALDDTSFDFFLLVREWPGTIARQPMPAYINTFTLHGLWPQRNDNTWPQFCNDSYPFSYAEVAPIMNALDNAWYDTMHAQANATDFWSHEWDKHGTCAMLGAPACCGSELKYFKTAIALHDMMTEVKWLANAGIVPSHSQTYPTSAFLSAMSSGLGGPNAMIKCSEMSGDRVVINNFAVCVSKSLNVQNCPDSLVRQWQDSAHCGDHIGYPVIPH